MTPMDDAASIEPQTTTPLSQAELDVLTDKLIEKLKTVYDPEIPEIRSCKVELVFDPPWDPSRMSDEAKLQLNMF